jgi:hypothetical protein
LASFSLVFLKAQPDMTNASFSAEVVLDTVNDYGKRPPQPAKGNYIFHCAPREALPWSRPGALPIFSCVNWTNTDYGGHAQIGGHSRRACKIEKL